MGRPTQSDRIARLGEKLKPVKEITGAFTQAQIDQLTTAGYTVRAALVVPPLMDPDDWTQAVGELSRTQREMAERLMASLGRKVTGPEGDGRDPE